jgi:hypothetical protein
MLRISFLAARNRASGEVSMLETAFGIAAGGDVASVTNRYHALLSPEGAADRADYSHILLVVENLVRQHHEFPDPKIAELAALKSKLSVARDEHAQALAAEDQAKALAADAAAAAKSRKAAATRLADLEAELARLSPPPPPAPTPEPVKPLGSPAEELAKLSDEHFALAAKEYQVEWQAGQPREAATAAILAAAGYK